MGFQLRRRRFINTGKIELTKGAKALIAEFELDPSLIVGTGKNGKIQKRDVQDFLKDHPIVEPNKENTSGDPGDSENSTSSEEE
ncbi:MAG: E3 binding domain-containing protein [Bacteroidota bacterium]